jgi:hypothetical protein
MQAVSVLLQAPAQVKAAKQAVLATQAIVSVAQLVVAHVAQAIAVEVEVEMVPPVLAAPPLDLLPPVLTAPPLDLAPPVLAAPTPPLPPVPEAGAESLLLPQAVMEVARIAKIPKALKVSIVSSDRMV